LYIEDVQSGNNNEVITRKNRKKILTFACNSVIIPLCLPAGEGFAENRTNRTSRPSQIYSLMNGASSMMNYQYAIRYTLYAPRFTLHASRSARTSAHKKTFLCKTNPISPDFAPKTRILPKNKPNSNPIQTQSKPIQTQTNPIQTQFKTGIAQRFHPNNQYLS